MKNQTIYKYQLSANGYQIHQLPFGAEILHVGQQNNEICVWALVDMNEHNIMSIEIEVYGTGHQLAETDKLREFLGTVMLHNGDYVFHIFKLK